MLVEAAVFHQHRNYDEGSEQPHPAPTHALSSPTNVTTKDVSLLLDTWRVHVKKEFILL